jgi:hypothetical protein
MVSARPQKASNGVIEPMPELRLVAKGQFIIADFSIPEMEARP